jgi:predicted transglutaminase-like cysteine proteinase
MRTFVSLMLISVLAFAHCGALGARESGGKPGSVVESRTPARDEVHRSRVLSRLTPGQVDDARRQTKLSEPPGFQDAQTPTVEIAAKWADLQSRIQSEEKTLAACRTDSSSCSPAARRFLQIVELGRQRQGRARLGEVNRAINTGIRAASDWAQYDVDDFWSSPLETLSSGGGDCEDYAILKYVALRELGIAEGDLRFLVVDHARRRTLHAVLAVRLGEEWLILDNLTMIMANSADARNYYRPLFVLDHRNLMRRHEHSGTAPLS